MKKIIFLLTAAVTLTFCKGPGSGPLVKDSFEKKEETKTMGGEKHMARVITEKAGVKIEPCADCITISKLLGDKKGFEGKVIKVKGQVTKYNAGIMGKNWIHIQDGTEYNEGFDLTITTDLTATVGETVTFEGKIALDKDFGYGYSYDVIMEEAKSIQ
jgi:predicted RNA-binding protein